MYKIVEKFLFSESLSRKITLGLLNQYQIFGNSWFLKTCLKILKILKLIEIYENRPEIP
jgi:hypothetical protein